MTAACNAFLAALAAFRATLNHENDRRLIDRLAGNVRKLRDTFP